MRQNTKSKVLRKVQGLLRNDTRSTYEIAALAKVSQPTVFKIKNMRSPNPGIETVEAIYKVLTGEALSAECMGARDK